MGFCIFMVSLSWPIFWLFFPILYLKTLYLLAVFGYPSSKLFIIHCLAGCMDLLAPVHTW